MFFPEKLNVSRKSRKSRKKEWVVSVAKVAVYKKVMFQTVIFWYSHAEVVKIQCLEWWFFGSIPANSRKFPQIPQIYIWKSGCLKKWCSGQWLFGFDKVAVKILMFWTVTFWWPLDNHFINFLCLDLIFWICKDGREMFWLVKKSLRKIQKYNVCFYLSIIIIFSALVFTILNISLCYSLVSVIL